MSIHHSDTNPRHKTVFCQNHWTAHVYVSHQNNMEKHDIVKKKMLSNEKPKESEPSKTSIYHAWAVIGECPSALQASFHALPSPSRL